MLGVLSLVESNFFCSWPPTFDIESKKPFAKKCSNLFHGDLGMVETIFFAFNFFFLTLKVKGK